VGFNIILAFYWVDGTFMTAVLGLNEGPIGENTTILSSWNAQPPNLKGEGGL